MEQAAFYLGIVVSAVHYTWNTLQTWLTNTFRLKECLLCQNNKFSIVGDIAGLLLFWEDVGGSSSVSSFNKHLDGFWRDLDLYYNNKACM